MKTKVNTENTNNNFWEEAREKVVATNRLPVNNPEDYPGFYADITDLAVEQLRHSDNIFKELHRMQADMVVTSVPLDDMYVTAFEKWSIQRTPEDVIVFYGYDTIFEFIKQFKCRRRNWINALKQKIKDIAEDEGRKYQFCWFSASLLWLTKWDCVQDEVYFTGGSSAAPWAREPWRGYLKQFSPDEVKEPLVSVGLDAGKDRQQFGREMMDMYSSFEKYKDMLPMAGREKPEKQYVVFRGKLHDRKAFENKCERAGQYYVLFDGSETLLFALKKITSTFQITKTQRQLLEKEGISVTDGEMLRGKGGKICELYIPYIYTSHVGSYKEKKPSVLSRFRMWVGYEEEVDMEALHIFVHDFWKYPKEGVYAFDSLEQFRCLYVGEAPSGNYGERLALKENTPVNTPESYHRKYLWEYEQTLDEDIAEHIGSIITSAPIAEDETGKKTFYEMHLFRLKSGEAFLLGYDELGLCVTSLTDKTLHTWIRKHLGESVYDYIFPNAEPEPCYADTAREIGHCCYPSYNGMWGLVTSKEVRDACEEPMEDETLYQDRETGRFFLYGTGYDRDEYYTMAELNIPCTEPAKIPLSDAEAALWMKEHCEAGTVERIFNGTDPSARD